MSEEDYMAKLANMMIDVGLATGHGDSFDDLLGTLKANIIELLEIEQLYENVCSAAEDHRWD